MTASFHDTRWTLVARSRGSDTEARAALSELCEAYYAPVVMFLRQDGREEEVARELAHDFFARLLAGGAMEGADPLRGRFRSYLLAAVKRFAADQREWAGALKRGGDREHVSLEGGGTDTQPGLQVEEKRVPAPDAAFDREWAVTLLARALASLERTLREEGKAEHFAVLKPWLTTEAADQPQAVAAGQLGLSAAAVKVAIHRLRQRFRAAVRAEIVQTVSAPEVVAEELEALRAALRSG
jgi:DNA-directed RNA polymerase specialized sigma24 family protein